MIILVMFLRTFRHSTRMKQPDWTSRDFFPRFIREVLDEVFRRAFLFPNHYLFVGIHKRHTRGGFTPGLCRDHQSFQGSDRRAILVIAIKARYGTHASLVSFHSINSVYTKTRVFKPLLILKRETKLACVP